MTDPDRYHYLALVFLLLHGAMLALTGTIPPVGNHDITSITCNNKSSKDLLLHIVLEGKS